MNWIVCLDDHYGMAFNGRRQSRDRAVTTDLLSYMDGRELWIHPASRLLFPEDCPNLKVSESFLELAGDETWCFVETVDPAPYAHLIRNVMVYSWGRSYPNDLIFPHEILINRHLSQRQYFPGFSHESICRELYEE